MLDALVIQLPANAETPMEGDAVLRYEIGRPASAAAISRIDIDVLPDGRGLPAGTGSVPDGKRLYAIGCAHCHGETGQGGAASALAGTSSVNPAAMAADKTIVRTVGNYWPYATTLFDYIRRAMPFDQPGSLTDPEVYALTAYVLYLNDLLEPDAVLDAASLPHVTMPAQPYFRTDRRGGKSSQ